MIYFTKNFYSTLANQLVSYIVHNRVFTSTCNRLPLLSHPFPRLGENLLPDPNPLLLFIRQHLLRVADRARQDLPDPRTEDLQREHGLTIADREADAVCVDGDNPRVHLRSNQNSYLCKAVEWWAVGAYLELGLSAQQRNGKVIDGVCLKGVVVPVAGLHDVVVGEPFQGGVGVLVDGGWVQSDGLVVGDVAPAFAFAGE